jgi:hypothetical protein
MPLTYIQMALMSLIPPWYFKAIND